MTLQSDLDALDLSRAPTLYAAGTALAVIVKAEMAAQFGWVLDSCDMVDGRVRVQNGRAVGERVIEMPL